MKLSVTIILSFLLSENNCTGLLIFHDLKTLAQQGVRISQAFCAVLLSLLFVAKLWCHRQLSFLETPA